jgi:glycolate oxidase iron-sulfur subunit
MSAGVALPVVGRSAFTGPDAPRDDDLARCVHCGLCLMNCPTFVATGLEPESPRGRIYLIRAAHEGRVPLTETALRHLDLCLQCRNCEAVCPSGVPYGRIMEAARAEIVRQGLGPALPRLLRRTVLAGLLPYRRRVEAVARLLRLYQASGLQRTVRHGWLGRLLPHPLRELEALAPSPSPRFFRPTAEPIRPSGPPRARVAFFFGCVMPYTHAHTQMATVRVLNRLGVEVLTPPAQTCCGALLVHAGEREAARALARRNVDLFLSLDVDAVVVNAAGCGSVLKEYGELLEHDPAYAERAARFAARVKDATEYVATLPFPEGLGSVAARVTYQDSCHLAHAQRITAAPRRLIRAVPGVQFVEMEHPDRCCGSAGIYNIVQREMSLRLLDGKVEEIAATGADIVVTANPGCMIQLEAGLRRWGLRARVMHVMDLLDLSYRCGRDAEAGS